MKAKRRMIFGLVLGGLLVVVIGLAVLLITQARLVWEPLTAQELEALRQAVRPEPQQEIVFHGSEGVLSSKWSWIASKLFPGVLLADAKINGRDVTLAIDSGVTIEELVLLYAPTARAVGLRLTSVSEPIPFPRPGFEFTTYIFGGVAERLEVGGLVISQVPVRVVAAHHRLKALGLTLFSLDGFLGISFLERFVATWDLEAHRLLLRRGPWEGSGPGLALHKAELEHEGKREKFYYVEGLLDGRGPYRVLIDTGASAPVLMVSSQIAKAYGQEQFRVGRLQLGDIKLEDLPTMNFEAVVGRELPPEAADVIILGTGLLKAKGFKRLTLDFPAGKLYLER